MNAHSAWVIHSHLDLLHVVAVVAVAASVDEAAAVAVAEVAVDSAD